ncbi:LysE family translocator [Pelagibius sp. Alg239-R121]|uniref:LysE family translocator n=1 Tax=Pelagibius sp. Alg239-R121 TaxID=2993448 RepID=UPI0024A6FC50|nr:LysE family translocator [Pelagibius sp. Alg239-R121]
MTLAEWLTFVAIWTVLSLPLGPNAINCMTAAVSNGTRRALWTVLGIALAGLTHMAIATLGFGTLLLAYAELYLVLKWLGIAYLVWLGVSLWRKPVMAASLGEREVQPAASLVRRGFTISMSNPKAILSYMAAFPQFIVAGEPLIPQLIVIVPTAITIIILVYSGYTAAGGGLAKLLTSVARQRLFNRAAASFYLVIAGALAFSDTRRA